MRTDFLLSQQSAREVDLAPWHDHASPHEAPINARRPSFDGLTISLHWATALLVLAAFTSAWLHALAEVRQSDFTPVLLQIHRSFGVTIWVVTAPRLAWRLTHASLPPFPTQMTKLHRATVRLSEYGLYALLLGQPATGLLTTFFAGVRSPCSYGGFRHSCHGTRCCGPRFIFHMSSAHGRSGSWP
jgi:cytochrome b561